MGRLTYENSVKIEFEDRLLLHLQTVIGTKLRRGEPFHFSWRDETSIGGGRTTVWVHPHCSLVYKFYGSRTPDLNRNWLEALMYTANSPTGLYIVPEPAATDEDDTISEKDAPDRLRATGSFDLLRLPSTSTSDLLRRVRLARETGRRQP